MNYQFENMTGEWVCNIGYWKRPIDKIFSSIGVTEFILEGMRFKYFRNLFEYRKSFILWIKELKHIENPGSFHLPCHRRDKLGSKLEITSSEPDKVVKKSTNHTRHLSFRCLPIVLPGSYYACNLPQSEFRHALTLTSNFVSFASWTNRACE